MAAKSFLIVARMRDLARGRKKSTCKAAIRHILIAAKPQQKVDFLGDYIMSAYCHNEMEISCGDAERVSLILSHLLNEQDAFDPERILPMPAALLVTQYGYTQLAGNSMSVCDEEGGWRVLSKCEMRGILRTGAGNCDDWVMANWGTFGVADESQVDRSQIDRGIVKIRFISFVFPPTVVLAKIRQTFPNAGITFSYRRDEDDVEMNDYPHLLEEGSTHERHLLRLARTWNDDSVPNTSGLKQPTPS